MLGVSSITAVVSLVLVVLRFGKCLTRVGIRMPQATVGGVVRFGRRNTMQRSTGIIHQNRQLGRLSAET